MDSVASIKKNHSNHRSSFSNNEVVLVTGPRCCKEDFDGTVQVEAATCESINLSPFLQPKSIRTVEPYLGPHQKDQSSNNNSNHNKNSNNNHNFDEPNAVELQEGTMPQSQQPVTLIDSPSEHGYKYSYTQDTQDDQEDQTPTLDTYLPGDFSTIYNSLTGLSFEQQTLQYPPIYILGKSYHRIQEYETRRNDESNLLWFTYRCDFPEIVPYKITTDAGWGCMLRSAQMMLAQAMRMHYKGRAWQPPSTLAKRKMDPFLRSILTWFADYPSRQDCVFSLHNMVAAGLAKYDVLPGEWYGPGTAAYVMRDLVQLYETQQIKYANTDPVFRVHVASHGTVYRNEVIDLVTKQSQKERSNQVQPKTTTFEPLHPLDTRIHTHTSTNTYESNADLSWDTALLLLIPLRLGLKTFNAEYTLGLVHIFSLHQSVGVLGGRPRGARWFYGASADGKLYGLDPHTIQMAPQRRSIPQKDGTTALVVGLTDEYLRSVHTTNPETMPLTRMDPSLALGFYCKDRADFDALCHSLETWNKAHPHLPELFTIANTVPDYSANMSSAMNDMMQSITGDEDDEGGHVSDEDEYVLL